MENASKALLIAGGVLIALIILTMFIVMYNNMANIQKEQEEQTRIEQIAAFNAEFEAYNKKVMYGTDVITLINKVAERTVKKNGSSEAIKAFNEFKEVITSSGNSSYKYLQNMLIIYPNNTY